MIDCCWSKDDRFIAVVTLNGLTVWDLEEKKILLETEMANFGVEDGAAHVSAKSCYSDHVSPLFGVVCHITPRNESEIRFFLFPTNFARVKSARKIQ